jgi:hypothetical protein
MVRGLLAIELPGSVPLFLVGTGLYLFSVTALGIFLATLARSMPQFGLLSIRTCCPAPPHRSRACLNGCRPRCKPRLPLIL